jgi:hypothetical protein
MPVARQDSLFKQGKRCEKLAPIGKEEDGDGREIMFRPKE